MSDLPKNTKKILLTGASGFLGSYILDLLCSKGYRVIAIKRPSSHTALLKHLDVEWLNADLFDNTVLHDALKETDTVIHAAGLVSFHAKDKKSLFKVNVEGTANLVNLSLESKIKRFIHISSVAALGIVPDNRMVNENHFGTEEKFSTQYAMSKYLGELEVWRGMAEGLDALILNPSIILGAGDWNRSSARLFNIVRQGLKFYPVGATGFVDVRDVAKITIQLLSSNIKSERFIVSAENITYRDLLVKMAHALEVKYPAVRAAKSLATIAMIADQFRSFFLGREAALTRETVRSSYTYIQYDHTKIVQALNYRFIPIDATINACAKIIKSNQPVRLLDW